MRTVPDCVRVALPFGIVLDDYAVRFELVQNHRHTYFLGAPVFDDQIGLTFCVVYLDDLFIKILAIKTKLGRRDDTFGSRWDDLHRYPFAVAVPIFNSAPK